MKTALQDLIEWAETPAMSTLDNKSIMTKMKELLEKEKQMIIAAHKDGYINGIRDEYYFDQYSQEYYDKLLSDSTHETGNTTAGLNCISHCEGMGNVQNSNRTPFGKGWMGKRK